MDNKNNNIKTDLSLPEKGAFIFNQHKNTDKENISLFIYARCSQRLLQKQLNFLNPEILKDHNFYMIVNYNYKEHIRSGTEEDIKEIINKDEIIDLLNNSYDKIKKMGLPFLEENYYNGVVEYSKKTLENIEEAEQSLLKENPQSENLKEE